MTDALVEMQKVLNLAYPHADKIEADWVKDRPDLISSRITYGDRGYLGCYSPNVLTADHQELIEYMRDESAWAFLPGTTF